MYAGQVFEELRRRDARCPDLHIRIPRRSSQSVPTMSSDLERAAREHPGPRADGPFDDSPGCPFADRCPRVSDRCPPRDASTRAALGNASRGVLASARERRPRGRGRMTWLVADEVNGALRAPDGRRPGGPGGAGGQRPSGWSASRDRASRPSLARCAASFPLPMDGCSSTTRRCGTRHGRATDKRRRVQMIFQDPFSFAESAHDRRRRRRRGG